MDIRIEPHPARELVHGELVPVIFDQRQVMVNGERVAWCGVRPGQPLHFLRRYPDAFLNEVKTFVEQDINGKVSFVGQPPADVPDEDDQPYDADDESEGDE